MSGPWLSLRRIRHVGAADTRRAAWRIAHDQKERVRIKAPMHCGTEKPGKRTAKSVSAQSPCAYPGTACVDTLQGGRLHRWQHTESRYCLLSASIAQLFPIYRNGAGRSRRVWYKTNAAGDMHPSDHYPYVWQRDGAGGNRGVNMKYCTCDEHCEVQAMLLLNSLLRRAMRPAGFPRSHKVTLPHRQTRMYYSCLVFAMNI